MYFHQIWRRLQKFPPQESNIVQKLFAIGFSVYQKTNLTIFYLFSKISIIFWIHHLAIINKPSFSCICSVCNDPNLSTGQGEKQINQGDDGKKDGLKILINYNEITYVNKLLKNWIIWSLFQPVSFVYLTFHSNCPPQDFLEEFWSPITILTCVHSYQQLVSMHLVQECRPQQRPNIAGSFHHSLQQRRWGCQGRQPRRYFAYCQEIRIQLILRKLVRIW